MKVNQIMLSDKTLILRLTFTNISGLCSKFAIHDSFFESNFLDILAFHETKLEDSTDLPSL